MLCKGGEIRRAGAWNSKLEQKELAFGTFTTQGLPFYGGNITYHIPVETRSGELTIRSSQYRGARRESVGLTITRFVKRA